jgi:hypothetical protein
MDSGAAQLGLGITALPRRFPASIGDRTVAVVATATATTRTSRMLERLACNGRSLEEKSFVRRRRTRAAVCKVTDYLSTSCSSRRSYALQCVGMKGFAGYHCVLVRVQYGQYF